MTKLLGLSLILLSSFLYARQRIGEGRRRADALGSFCVMLEQMHGLLQTQAAPMPELLQTLARRCPGSAALFAERLARSMDRLGGESFCALWQQALSLVDDLDHSALRELGALGGILGRYDLHTQLDSLGACLSSLRQLREELRQTQPQSRRLTLGISLSAALLLGILLI